MAAVDRHLAARLEAVADELAQGWWANVQAAARAQPLQDPSVQTRIRAFAGQILRDLGTSAPSPDLREDAAWLARLYCDRGAPIEELYRHFADLEALALAALDRELLAAPLLGTASELSALTRALHKRLRDLSDELSAVYREVAMRERREHRDLLSRFAHELNHELKNRLALAALAAAMLDEALVAHEHQRAAALSQRISQILGQLRSATTDLLAVTATRTTDATIVGTPGRLDQLLDALLLEFEPMAEHHHVELRRPADAPPLLLDASRFRLIMSNLLHNSVKFSDPDKSERWVQITITPAGPPRHWRVDVADNGRGIPPGLRERIFTAGFRAHTGEPGQGLGLALARQAALQLGGYLWVISEPGRGSTFSFTFSELRQDPSA
jgi:signal transduction histidine kinase